MWEIQPERGIGPLSLGATLESASRSLLGPPAEFRRTPTDVERVFAFDRSGVQLRVDQNGVVNGVLVFRPNTVSLAGVQLLNEPISEVGTQLELKGISGELCDAGAWYPKHHILLIEVDGVVDGVELSVRRD